MNPPNILKITIIVAVLFTVFANIFIVLFHNQNNKSNSNNGYYASSSSSPSSVDNYQKVLFNMLKSDFVNVKGKSAATKKTTTTGTTVTRKNKRRRRKDESSRSTTTTRADDDDAINDDAINDDVDDDEDDVDDDGAKIVDSSSTSTTTTINFSCDDKDAIDKARQRLQKLKRDKIRVLKVPFLKLHLGKAGGGAAGIRAHKDWRIKFPNVHLKVPSQQKRDEFGTSAKIQVVIVHLRDPVDRFVSAYYWRQLVYCDPISKNEKRIRAKHPKQANMYPDQYCTDKPLLKYSERELDVLYSNTTYHRDANELAAALCSSDKRTYQQATNDMELIGHSKNSITDWLGLNTQRYKGIMFPIVMEKPYDFISQIDDAFVFGFHKSKFESSKDFQLRQTAVQIQDKITECENDAIATDTADDTPTNTRRDLKSTGTTIAGGGTGGGGAAHSSSQSSSKKKLTPQNEACVAKYYYTDYMLLREIQDLLCQSDICRRAIQSILDRRGPMLQQQTKEEEGIMKVPAGVKKTSDGKWLFPSPTAATSS